MKEHYLEIRGLRIGEGIPKICVPIVEAGREELIAAAVSLRTAPCDIVEWRADWFNAVYDAEEVIETLGVLRGEIGEIPMIFTFRTAEEGGERSIEPDAYAELLAAVSTSEAVDLIDVELSQGEARVRRLIDVIQANGKRVILSSHDFKKTPGQTELVETLLQMQALGADIPKLAVMPRSAADVLTLLAATREVAEEHADRPVITMSMGKLGTVSRISGEVFGSAVTFGTVGRGSAPGQLDAYALSGMLRQLHLQGEAR